MTTVKHVIKTQLVNIFVDVLDEASNRTDDQNTSYLIVSDFYELNDLLHRKKLWSMICFLCRHFPVITNNQGQDVYVEKENQVDISVYVYDELYRRLSISRSEQQYLVELQDAIVRGAQGVF